MTTIANLTTPLQPPAEPGAALVAPPVLLTVEQVQAILQANRDAFAQLMQAGAFHQSAPQPASPRLLYDARAVAAALGCSERTAWARMQAREFGEIIPNGKLRCVRRTGVEAWVAGGGNAEAAG